MAEVTRRITVHRQFTARRILRTATVATACSGALAATVRHAGEIHYFPFLADLACEGGPAPDATGSVRVVKTDAEGGPALPGAQFELWEESKGREDLQTDGGDADARVATVCTTNVAGLCALGDLDPGTYYLRETGVRTGRLCSARRPGRGPVHRQR